MHCMPRPLLLLASCLFLPNALADYLGPRYSAPKDLSSSQSLVAAAWKEIESTLETVLLQGGNGNQTQTSLPANVTSAVARNVTFSLGLFSLHDRTTTSQQYHYTSPEIINATNGTHNVDSESIYRVASVTKVFTVLAGLLELKDADWDLPLTELLPGLGPSDDSSVYSTPWDQVTMRSLAAQLGGVPRDGFPNPGEILIQALGAGIDEATLMAASGLPPFNASDPVETPACLVSLLQGTDCPPTTYVEGTADRPPAFFPWTTPGYSNNGFTLLGLAIGNASGKNIEQIYSERIFEPLSLASTYSAVPPPSEWNRSVIVGVPASSFSASNGVFVSSGGLFSTLRDLTSFGVSVLNSTLLPADRTRRWLKPVSHTARLSYSIGAPWEIVRYTLASGVVTDIYTKLGDSGSYSAYLVLLPDYDAGFALLTASSSTQRVAVTAAIADLVSNKLVPALAAQAALEAARAYAGQYAADGLNSSLTLSVDATETAAPGLIISSWISNGTDVLSWLDALLLNPPFRLVPSITETATGKPGQVAFRLITEVDAPSPDDAGLLFSKPGALTSDWSDPDVNTYYGVGLSLFVFDVGCDGKAKAVSPAAWRVKLTRTA